MRDKDKPKKLTAKQKAALADAYGFPKMTFGEALLDAEICGFIVPGSLWRLDDTVYCCDVSSHGFGALAHELAFNLPGQLRPLRNGKGIVWINGSNGPAGVILSWSSYKDVIVSRETVHRLVQWKKQPWTMGQCARLLIEHIGDKQPYECNAELLLKGVPYGYHECTPGLHIGTEPRYVPSGERARDLFEEIRHEVPNPAYTPAVTMWDVEGYYYAMLKRLPSLFWTVYPSHAEGHIMNGETMASWRDVLSCVDGNKTLRNSLAGAFAGTVNKGASYCRDYEKGGVKKIHPPGTPGPFRAAGLLIVRSGVELCHKEALTVNSIYATIDSVVTRGDTVPVVWPSFGFSVGRKCAGNAEICHRGSYQIGNKATDNYKNGHREYYPVERQPLPSVNYHRSWL